MNTGVNSPSGITIKSPRELDLMREAGRVVASAKQAVKDAIRPGVTSKEMDAVAEEVIRKHGATPSFKGYKPTPSKPCPATICFSFNEEIVHGIPGNRKIKSGDIVSVDFGAIVEGFHGDSAFTVAVGDVSEETERLISATKIALDKGISEAKEGARLTDISHAVQSYAESEGFSVVKEYVGHGIGRSLHEEPQVPNYGKPGRGPKLKVGMTLAIEPMLNVGTWQTKALDDGWTVVTADGELSAHYEHTIAVTENGPEILTPGPF